MTNAGGTRKHLSTVHSHGDSVADAGLCQRNFQVLGLTETKESMLVVCESMFLALCLIETRRPILMVNESTFQMFSLTEIGGRCWWYVTSHFKYWASKKQIGR